MSNACPQCGTDMVIGPRRDWPSYAGLPWATLRALGTYVCPNCGEDAISIPRIAQLHRALAAVIVGKRAPLTSHERRFLRDFIGWTEEDLAQRMGISPEAVEEWERGDEEPGPIAERLLRMLAATRLPGGVLTDEVLVHISDNAAPFEVKMQASEDGWNEAA